MGLLSTYNARRAGKPDRYKKADLRRRPHASTIAGQITALPVSDIDDMGFVS